MPRSAKRSLTQGELLERLDSKTSPGITNTQLQRLLARCECGMITTRRAFRSHVCIIDISDDDEVESDD